MASKIFDLRDNNAVLTIPMGGELPSVVFRRGVAVVSNPDIIANLGKYLDATMPEMYEVRDYDPGVDKPANYVPGASQASTLVQGVMSHGGSSNAFTNPVVAELDSQLAQALVSGTVDELAAANPEVLEGAGFVANSAPAAKPVLGKAAK